MSTDTPPTAAELRDAASQMEFAYAGACDHKRQSCDDVGCHRKQIHMMARHILATVGTDYDPTHLNAENSRLRELLTNAYTVKPLEWGPYGSDEWAASSGTGFTVRQHPTEERKWSLYVGAMCMCREFATPDAAKQEAEKMHIDRITTSLTKVEQAKPSTA